MNFFILHTLDFRLLPQFIIQHSEFTKVSGFTFSLAAVLKHRLHLEREKMRAVAEVQAKMNGLKAELAGIEQTVRSSTEDLRGSHLAGRLDMSFIAAHRRFSAAMNAKAMNLVQQMARVQVQVEQAQRELAEAAKERKIMEKLRERQFERWREETSKKETAALDEIGMQMGGGMNDER